MNKIIKQNYSPKICRLWVEITLPASFSQLSLVQESQPWKHYTCGNDIYPQCMNYVDITIQCCQEPASFYK